MFIKLYVPYNSLRGLALKLKILILQNLPHTLEFGTNEKDLPQQILIQNYGQC